MRPQLEPDRQVVKYGMPLLIVLFGLVAPLAAQECPSLDGFRPFGKTEMAVVSGDFVYACGWDYCYAVDVSSASSARMVASFTMPFDTAGIIGLGHDGELLVVSRGDGLLRMYSTSNPSAPAQVGTISLSNFAYDLVLRNDALFVCDSGFGLRVFDVSDPSLPVEIDTVTVFDQINKIALVGDLALVLDKYTVFVLDVSDPANVTETGSATLSLSPGRHIDASGSRAAVIAGGTLIVVDYSTPDSPEEIGFMSLSLSASEVAISGDVVSIAHGLNGWRLVDISVPSAPVVASTISHTYLSAGGVQIVGDTMYGFDVSNTSNGVYIYDVLPPTDPLPLGSYPFPMVAAAIQVIGDVALLQETAGIRILDVSDPVLPVEVRLHRLPSSPVDMDVRNDLAAVALSDEQGIQLLDISQADDPVEISRYTDAFTEYAGEVLLGNGFMYFVENRRGSLSVVDLSDVFNPVGVGHFYIYDDITSMALSGEYLLIGTASSPGDELKILDVSDPSLPTIVSSTARSSQINAIAVSGDLAYLGSNTFDIVDISNPTNPVDLGTYFPPFTREIRGIHLHHSNAYLRVTSRGLVVLDISRPQTPFEVGALEVFDSFGGFDLKGGYGLVGGYDLGLLSIDVGCLPIFWDDFESGGTWAWSRVIE